jgi:hypothetical protein
MASMKAAVIHEAGGPEVLKIESLAIPTPKGGEVLIRVKGVWPQPFRIVYPAGSFSKCQVSARLGYRSSRCRRGSARRGVSKRRYRCDGDGRPGAPNRRGLCRIYLRGRETGAGHQDRTSLGKPSERSPRCCKQRGVHCSNRCASKKGSVC